MSDVLQVIKTRSSIRGYKADKLTKEEIAILINAGLMAPTATNRQELHFSVVDTDNEAVKELCNDIKPGTPFIFHYGAPTLIMISGEEAFGWSDIDSGIAVENIHLAAKAIGLGSVILGIIGMAMNGEKKAYYAEKFDIPEGYNFKIAIAVGHPAVDKEPHEIDAARDVSFI